ncbi:phage minor capsid protein [Streptomyces sp. NPDC059371]|uniref:phage minor capsid protein n=1 Tax=Streptomyces sp. NPDC059371 TaxID=3346812 RepID=UPI0036892F51
METRRQAIQTAVQRLTDRGITSFVDRSGRAWSMPSYAEMATRTAVGRAQALRRHHFLDRAEHAVVRQRCSPASTGTRRAPARAVLDEHPSRVPPGLHQRIRTIAAPPIPARRSPCPERGSRLT